MLCIYKKSVLRIDQTRIGAPKSDGNSDAKQTMGSSDDVISLG